MTNNDYWNTQDLVRRIDRALDFAEAAISLIELDDPAIDVDALEAPPDKIIAETAMFLRSVLRTPGELATNVRERARRLAEELIRHARHSRVQIGVALFPALALDYGAAHIVLGSAGFPDEDFSGTIRRSLESTTASARERFPHRELEQAWLTSLLEATPLDDAIASRTSLLRGIDVISGSRDDAYSLTHALMYATDFGNVEPGDRLPTDQILSISRSALVGVLDDDDFDLAGELLLSWPFLREPWDNTASFAFGVLASVEDSVGVLPSLALDLNEYRKLPPASRPSYVAAVAYHTAYVMGLLCASALRAGENPMSRPSKSESSSKFANYLFQNLRADGSRTPQWLRYAETLPEKSLPAYTEFLLDAALRRSLRRTDFQAAHSLLSMAADHDVDVSRLYVQAAEMLNRLARSIRPAEVLCPA